MYICGYRVCVFNMLSPHGVIDCMTAFHNTVEFIKFSNYQISVIMAAYLQLQFAVSICMKQDSHTQIVICAMSNMTGFR